MRVTWAPFWQHRRMAVITRDIVPLNRTEFGYAAIEGLAGTMLMPTLVRFSAPVSVAEIRAVLRQVVTAYPKLRAVLEPGLHRYHFRIFPEGPLIDQMFEQAFKVQPWVDIDDPVALEAWHRELVNEQVPLEHGLCVRMRFVPHPQRPVLIFAVPHLITDGMTKVHLLKQILRGLNGLPVEPMPVEAPSMIGAIAPERWWQWPTQMWRARKHKLAESKLLRTLHVQQVPTQLGPHYTSTALRHHEASTSTTLVRQAARRLGVSLNTFLVASIAQTFLEQAPDDPLAAAVIRISVDLRKYYPASAGHGPLWGNHVGAYLVIETGGQKSVAERVRSVDACVKEGLARYARREMCWTYLFEELTPLLGRTLVGHIGTQLKRAHRFPKISCHATTLGNVSDINPPDARVGVDTVFVTVNSISPLPVLAEKDGRLFLPTSWQLAETSVADMADFHRRFDAVLARMVEEALR
jgi:hypothetical protein